MKNGNIILLNEWRVIYGTSTREAPFRRFLFWWYMIDYKTYDEQISILKSRGLIITDDDNVKNFLKANNYYNVVNAYKDIFIKKGITPEKYVQNANFNELIAIHSFDKNLRILLSNNLIIIERLLKSITAHEFSKRHSIDGYLNINDYDTTITRSEDGMQVTAASKLIRKLDDELNDALDHNDEMITHYKAKYGAVPLWVFINKLSFGTLSKMFAVLNSEDKFYIAKSISEYTNLKSNARDISNAIKILVLLRNKAAHDQKIYDFTSKSLTVNVLNTAIKKYGLSNGQSLFGAICCMSMFLTEKQFKVLCQDVRKLIKELFLNIHSIPTQTILNKMGIPNEFLN